MKKIIINGLILLSFIGVFLSFFIYNTGQKKIEDYSVLGIDWHFAINTVEVSKEVNKEIHEEVIKPLYRENYKIGNKNKIISENTLEENVDTYFSEVDEELNVKESVLDYKEVDIDSIRNGLVNHCEEQLGYFCRFTMQSLLSEINNYEEDIKNKIESIEFYADEYEILSFYEDDLFLRIGELREEKKAILDKLLSIESEGLEEYKYLVKYYDITYRIINNKNNIIIQEKAGKNKYFDVFYFLKSGENYIYIRSGEGKEKLMKEKLSYLNIQEYNKYSDDIKKAKLFFKYAMIFFFIVFLILLRISFEEKKAS